MTTVTYDEQAVALAAEAALLDGQARTVRHYAHALSDAGLAQRARDARQRAALYEQSASECRAQATRALWRSLQ